MYTYTINAIGKAVIEQFVLERGADNQNVDAYYATAEVEADNFNVGEHALARITIEPNCSIDGLEHALLLERNWFEAEALKD